MSILPYVLLYKVCPLNHGIEGYTCATPALVIAYNYSVCLCGMHIHVHVHMHTIYIYIYIWSMDGDTCICMEFAVATHIALAILCIASSTIAKGIHINILKRK